MAYLMALERGGRHHPVRRPTSRRSFLAKLKVTDGVWISGEQMISFILLGSLFEATC
jgi:hypothetical protein